jgi:uncharacterized protein YdhG (YjbR/CyaY superfamily)
MTDRKTSAEVEAYLAAVPEIHRGLLERIRSIIRAEAPEADEVIGYGIPTFKLDGNLVHYAAFKNHCSFFPGSLVQNQAFAAELAGFKTAKGTIQFTPENPLPDELVRRIVIARITENRDAAAARRKKPRKAPTSPASSES